ncbi:MAG TPA: peptidylprolyl isomerase [Negativicutes bacterium]|nr:peptidylprolyl isomerase [Negativicutes bacterium]
MTTQDQLNQINGAISAVENGAQEYQIGSRRISKPNIYNLYRERERLEQKLAQENNGGIYVAAFDRR